MTTPNTAALPPTPGTLSLAVAGHCTLGANKIWLGGAGLDPTGQPIAWVVWGSANGPYTAQINQLPTLLAAEALISKKANEKLGRANAAGVRQGGEYTPVALDRFPVGPVLTAKGGGWIGAALTAQAATTPLPPDSVGPGAPATAAPARVGLAHVLPCPAPDLDRLLGDPGWGASQKVNGVRAQIVGVRLPDGTVELSAWSRTNRPLAVPPAGLALTALAALTPDLTGLLFILDGEIGAAELPVGSLVVFDYLARQGDLGLRGQPYATRISTLTADLGAARIAHTAAPWFLSPIPAADPVLGVLIPTTGAGLKAALLTAVTTGRGGRDHPAPLGRPGSPRGHPRYLKAQTSGRCGLFCHRDQAGAGWGQREAGADPAQ